MFPKSAFQALVAVFFLVIVILVTAPAFASEETALPDNDAPMYVDFKNIVVPVIKKNGQTGVVALSLMAQVKDQDDQSKVVDNLPRLRDAFIRSLYGSLSNKKFLTEEGALDIPQIKDHLMKTAGLVLKGDDKGLIKDILFQNIAQQTY
jgi:flagellar basal body-associated protein FliL